MEDVNLPVSKTLIERNGSRLKISYSVKAEDSVAKPANAPTTKAKCVLIKRMKPVEIVAPESIKQEVLDFDQYQEEQIVVTPKLEFYPEPYNTEDLIDEDRSHLPIILENGPLKCKKCPKEFQTLMAFRIHFRGAHTKENYKCTNCFQGFVADSDLRMHVEEHHPFPCLLCTNKYFSDQFELARHNEKCHLAVKSEFNLFEPVVKIEDNAPTELIGSSKFRSGEVMEHVMKMDHGTLLCLICHKEWKSVAGYKQHFRNSHQIKTYKCKQCSTEFTVEDDLQQHECKNRSEKPVKRFGCTNCDLEFPFEVFLRYHNQKKHLKYKYHCRNCEESYETPEQLADHEITHFNAFVYCPVCNKQFITKSKLDLHLKIHDKTCRICGSKKFKNMAHRKLHEKECTNTKFGLKNSSKKHMKAEAKKQRLTIKKLKASKLTEFYCEQCYIGFPFEILLRYHNQKKHLKYKNHCQNCEESYETPEQLADHEQSHLNAFVNCPICNQIFLSKTQLNIHLKTRHRRTCQYCRIKQQTAYSRKVHEKECPKRTTCDSMQQPEQKMETSATDDLFGCQIKQEPDAVNSQLELKIKDEPLED